MTRRLFIALIALLGLCLPHAGSAQAPSSLRFRATALSGGVALNNRGEIAGTALTGELTPQGGPIFHATLWTDVNTRRDLGVLPGGIYSEGVALNNLGQVVGSSQTGRFKFGSTLRIQHAFFWDPARGMVDLGVLGTAPDAESFAIAVNDLSQVVGMSSGHAFLWDPQRGMRDLGTEFVPLSINNRGEVLFQESVWTEAGGFRPLEQVTGGQRVPGVFAIGAQTGPHGINDRGQIPLLGTVGLQPNGDGLPSPINIPMRFDPGRGIRVLDPNGASTATAARAVNNSGQVIGTTVRPVAPQPLYEYLYDDVAGLLDLQTLIATPGWRVFLAGDLNDPGQVLGVGFRPTIAGDQFVGMLLTPETSTPSVRVLDVYVISSVRAGQPAPGVVVLGQPAPAGGATVRLTSVSGNPGAFTVPQTVVVPAGQTQARFTITTRPVPVDEDLGLSLILTATYGGVTERAGLGVIPADAVEPPLPEPLDPEPAFLTLDPARVTGGTAVDGTLTLTAPAPPGGLTVTLRSSDPAAGVPTQVTVPAGAGTATFRITTRAVTSLKRVTISATHGSTATATLEIAPPAGDTVTIQQATYAVRKRRLTVNASSTQSRATLRAYTAAGALIGTLKRAGTGRYRGQFTVRTDPGQVTVRSSLGGSASMATTRL
jgi:probable HAF family extracellular repeat protein